MEKEYKYGKMERNMKVNGPIIKHKEEEYSFIQMGTYMRENFKMIVRMAMGFITIKMDLNIKGTGRMT